MSRVRDRRERRIRIRRRYRSTVRGTEERPRLAVCRSLRHVYAQIIDDRRGVTLVAASTQEPEVRGGLKAGGNRDAGTVVGRLIAERAKERGLETVVFDRGGFAYHGVIRAVADAARKAGLKF
jgi:large subunit ribosomal protein L18